MNIYNICYNAIVLKRLGKLLKIALSEPYLGKNRVTIWAAPKNKVNFVLEITKGHKLQWLK